MLIDHLFNLRGKVALVTGASSGLGYRFSQVLAQAGATVIATSIRPEGLQKLCDEIHTAGGQALAIPIDVSSPESVSLGVNQAIEKTERIDILVNNAGIALKTPLLDGSLEDFDAQLNVNLRGCWLMIRAVAPHMISRKIPGSIVNIASINGAHRPVREASGYCASKAGIIQLTKQLVGELSPYNIRINAIVPGLIHTLRKAEQIRQHYVEVMQMIPLRFVGQPWDLDGALLYLCSNAASRYVTGSCLTVDGGMSSNVT
jgi:NAD(P)-dependent dehydrogenase (short-subunit alcohol dehydrogenase family)